MIPNNFFPYLLQITSQTNNTAEEQSFLTIFIQEKLPSYIFAIILIIISFIVAKIIQGILSKKFEEEKLRDTPIEIVVLVKRSTFGFVFLIFTLLSLGITGIVGNLGWLFGAIGLGIGVAIQGIVSHFIAGILIIMQKKTGIGNYVKLENVEGTILEIGTRATTIQTLDGVEVLVPNKLFIDNEVTIYTSNPYRRISIPLQIEYSTDITKASEGILKMLSTNKEIMNDAPKEVLINGFKDGQVDITLRFWIKSRSEWWTIQSNVIKDIKALFESEKINLPYTKSIVHIVK